jgi:hypothetical protein
MGIEGRQIRMDIAGLGIVFYSPKNVEHIREGDDYLQANYLTDKQVQSHIQKGSLVGFGTGSPGVFVLTFHSGYPTNAFVGESDFKLRLGLHCVGGIVCFRDLYDLMQWTSECPPEQALELEDGVYHVTLCSNRPESGIIGDTQVIHVYLQELDSFPALAKGGIPHLSP